MMVAYLGHMIENELKMEFVFSVGNLNGPTGNIPTNELDIMERSTKQCEKLLEWMQSVSRNRDILHQIRSEPK